MRGGAIKSLNVKIGEAQAPKVAGANTSAEPQGRLGLAVRPLDQDEQQQLGVRGGLVVQDVSGPSAIAGIQSGDVILSLNGTAITNVDQLRKLTDKAGKNVALLVARGDEKIFVPVNLN